VTGRADEWAADIAVDGNLVRGLLAGQFPELALTSLARMAEGWDNSVWLVDGRWVFRFPRRKIALAGVVREIGLLPRLAPLLPLPIPEPQLVGRAASAYPWPFFGARLLPGREMADAGLREADRRRLARPLATFLRRLHSAEVAAAVDPGGELPADPNRRDDMPRRVPWALERLAELERRGLWRAPAGLSDQLSAALDIPAGPASSIAHGDLHLRHLLVADDGSPCAVIDWGDLCRADPAIDLPLIWSALPADARAEFLAAYGPVTGEQLLRARVLAVFLCATLALYARHEGLPNLQREAIGGLDRAAAPA
jgi:aminoglycoside phosphotransferase (APT) family kinase protein